MLRRGFFWLPPILGAAALCWIAGSLQIGAMALLLLAPAAHLGLAMIGRRADWVTRFLLGILTFAGLMAAAYSLALLVAPAAVYNGGGVPHRAMPTGQVLISFLVAGALASVWRFSFLRRPMTAPDRALANACGGVVLALAPVFFFLY